jgi:hypothetical protein
MKGELTMHAKSYGNFLVPGLVCFAILFSPALCSAQTVAVPSVWRGTISGQVAGRNFSLPLTMELKPPLEGENNPVHFFLGDSTSERVGGLILTSSQQYTTPYTSGTATLQYMSVRIGQGRLQAVLRDSHRKEAAAVNGFTAPNLSAENASPLMKGVLESLGRTEMFAFKPGAVVDVQFRGNSLQGTVQGTGSSYMSVHSTPDAAYRARFNATRVQ